MTTQDDKNKDLENITSANAPTFDELSFEDRMLIRAVHTNQIKHNEIPSEIRDNIGLSLEYTTIMYNAQKCAFQDVLTKKGYEEVSDIPRDYKGNIAILTALGTLIMLGKPRPYKRTFTMTRTYDLKNSVDNRRSRLEDDLAVKKSAKICILNFESDIKCDMATSNIMGLCINPNGIDDNIEAEKMDHLDSILGIHYSVISMGTKTQNELLKTKKPVLPNGKNTGKGTYVA